MDSLALLCNLHADGPATLGALRRAGCQSLADLQRLSPQSLSELLQVPPAMARRLSREARILAERVGEEPLEPEEAPEGMVVPLEGGTGPVPPAPADLQPEANGSTWPAETLTPTDRLVMERALAQKPAFRSHPEDTPAASPGTWDLAESPRSAGAETQDTSAPSQAASPAKPVPPAAFAPRPHPGAALIGAVDGLDRVVAGALANVGVNTLEDLVDRDAGPLARQTGLNFSQVRRFQFLARRTLLSEESNPTERRSEPLPPKAPSMGEGEASPSSQAPMEPAPLAPKYTPDHDVATLLGAPLLPAELPQELQATQDEPIHLPAQQEEPVGGTVAVTPAGEIASQFDPEPPTVDLPDHPVAEFEPQSGGPMVAPQSLDAPWRPEELGAPGEVAQAQPVEPVEVTQPEGTQAEAKPIETPQEKMQSELLQAEPIQAEAQNEVTSEVTSEVPSDAMPTEANPSGEQDLPVERPVTPLGRWVPKALRGVEETPIEAVEPEPVLVPPPPPRRFWEPKRFWEARKNRREKAALEAKSETENLPEPDAEVRAVAPSEAVQQPLEAQAPVEEAMQAAQESDGVRVPQSGALPWDFGATPEGERAAPNTANMTGVRPASEGPRGRGFEFADREADATREDASGPFA